MALNFIRSTPAPYGPVSSYPEIDRETTAVSCKKKPEHVNIHSIQTRRFPCNRPARRLRFDMNRFTADLHIHSRFSRATSKNLTIRNLAAWARVKGLDVIGTGDFTHPEWLAEIKSQLQEDDSGLLTLREPANLNAEIPGVGRPLSGQTRFMLETEISSIYKRGDKVRKVHNLVYLPNLDAVQRFNQKLGQVGNLASDGRPILGLDSRDLLEMVLSIDPMAFLVPAHIWTPWFSLFGSKSGFDSVQECYGDLSSHIFAMETGLSSDPEMNWTISALDRYQLISNSDAHSGEKLGRETNLFQGELSYEGIYRALRGEGLGQKFLGTVEFFPEEGKYHLDGHRKCGVVLDPQETKARGGLCPVCGKPLTLGVLSRVLDLADREHPERPAGHPGYVSLVPLREIIGEILNQGPNTKKVHEMYYRTLTTLGSELTVLRHVPLEDIRRIHPALAEAVSRVREGQVIRTPGYDGEYGVISVFTPRERERILNGRGLMDLPLGEVPEPSASKPAKAPTTSPDTPSSGSTDHVLSSASTPDTDSTSTQNLVPSETARLPTVEPMAVRVADASLSVRYNSRQMAALQAGPGPVLVLAGPGTGKTQTMLGRITRLLDTGVKPRRILALTFTRRAARDLRRRLSALRGLSPEDPTPQAGTIHSLAFDYWKHAQGDPPVVLGDESARRVFASANPEMSHQELNRALTALELARETRTPLADDPALAEAAARYTKQKASWNLADYSDLLEFLLEQAEGGRLKGLYSHVLVDEVQDLTELQLAAVTSLVPDDGTGFFAIGDPRQSIYGFRGAVGDVAARLSARWPGLKRITLRDNYRSGQTVLDVAAGLFPKDERLTAQRSTAAQVHMFEAPDAMREASWIADRIRRLIGATSHSLADAGGQGELTPGDIAVLVRFRALIPPLVKALRRFGVPCAAPEQEAFYAEPRVAAILASAGRALGLGPVPALPPAREADGSGGNAQELDLPEALLAIGPQALSAHLHGVGSFDDFFWESRAFCELKKAYAERGGWAGLINWVNLQSELDQVGLIAEKVQIMSLHAAKGLEFEAVFLPALEDGILPFAGAAALNGKVSNEKHLTPEGLLEERRLLYVGLTRARRILCLSRAGRRQLFGRTLNLPASRLLADLPLTMITHSVLTSRTVKKERQLGLLD